MAPTQSLPERSEVIPVGSPAPNFTLLDQDRQEWTLYEQLEKGPVVLCFFPLAFTEVCTREMGCITKQFSDWSGKGLQIVGVSCDSFATLNAWGDRAGYTHRLLADMHRAVCKGYGMYWGDLNVSSRGTVIIEKNDQGEPTVTFAEGRDPGVAMDLDAIIAAAV